MAKDFWPRRRRRRDGHQRVHDDALTFLPAQLDGVHAAHPDGDPGTQVNDLRLTPTCKPLRRRRRGEPGSDRVDRGVTRARVAIGTKDGEKGCQHASVAQQMAHRRAHHGRAMWVCTPNTDSRGD